MPDYMINALFVTCGLMLLVRLAELIRRAARPLLRLGLHGLTGLVLLLMGNTVGNLFGLGLGLNALTLSVSAALGAPGVALLWTVRYVVLG
ncbi:MAG: pro-sigmaK processing inhibitor BofA family protein [Oscillospiraceae bacterium]|nr:pro-sigmaK processing inhibitor BofA family protein [Oscillospiraceae bacterium]